MKGKQTVDNKVYVVKCADYEQVEEKKQKKEPLK